MKNNIPKIIDLSPFFKLPENAHDVIFISPLSFRPNKELGISIERCSIGKSFYIGSVRMIYIKGLKYLIHNIPENVIVHSKCISSKTYVDYLFYNNGKKDFNVNNKTNWLASFPEKHDDERSLSAGKDFFLLQNTDYRSLTPPEFEKIFKNVFNYCETMEFYELCAELMNFAKDWFTFYENRFEKEPLLKVTKGWGWLYFLINKTKSASINETVKMIEA